MASSKMNTRSKPRCNLFPSHNPISNSDGMFQFDEDDSWDNPSAGSNNSAVGPEHMRTSIPREHRRRSSIMSDQNGGVMMSTGNMTSASLPVNIPDWSKILKTSEQRKDVSAGEDVFFDEELDEEERVPPHVYLARSRGASFSVHEGIGRTLKGRDLRRVRNAIWKKVGFED